MQTDLQIYHLQLTSLADTENLAKKLASYVKPGSVITLTGDLGVGKTSLARFFINYFYDLPQEVPSPTFTLVQTYPTPNFTIWHFDLYRLNSISDIFELGIEDALSGGVSIIEWPELIAELLPADRLEINLRNTLENDYRTVTIKAYGFFKTKEF